MRADSLPIRRVAILAPMRSELQPLIRPLGLRRTRAGQDDLWIGAAGRIEVVAALTRVGTKAAARTAERVLESTPVDHLLVAGVAGGIGPSVDIGSLVVPEVVVDLATSAAFRPHAIGTRAPRGTLVTSDELLSDPAKAASLEQQGVIAVDMETAAIAAVCERQGCPWSVFRAISDRADDGSTDPAIFGLAGADGTPNWPALLPFVLSKPGRIPQLARLGRGLSLATRAAADAAVCALQAL